MGALERRDPLDPDVLDLHVARRGECDAVGDIGPFDEEALDVDRSARCAVADLERGVVLIGRVAA